jgi:hypothetical protein
VIRVVLVVLLTGTGFLHASPAWAQWTQGKAGKVWLKSAMFWQRTGQEFDAVGNRRERIDQGTSNSRAIFTDVIVGLHPRLDLWLQIPFLDLAFSSPAEDLHSRGFGDVRAWLRWQPVQLGASTPLALRVGAKAPLGFSPLDVTIVPLGEGQWDLEVFGEIGHSFWPAPIYAELWAGYRARFANATTLKDPGGEYVFLLEGGVNPSTRTLLKATLDGFAGRNWIVEGIETSSSRRILTLQLGGAVQVVGPVWVEAGGRYPLAGRTFPAGAQLVLGLSGRLR